MARFSVVVERLPDELIATVRGRRVGGVTFERDENGRRFINRPSGYVTPFMVRQTLAEAERFGAGFPNGWSYVVVAEGMLIPDPRNARCLKQIPELTNMEKYIIVAPNRFVRALAHALKLISHPDVIAKSVV